MTKEDKELLLKDLCSRLPYGVKCLHPKTGQVVEIKNLNLYAGVVDMMPAFKIEEVKPYLRPISSMTVEEEYEYHQCNNIDYLAICEMEHTEMLKVTALCFSRATDWLNKKGFDYRDLIPRGLALEALEDMYNKKGENY